MNSTTYHWLVTHEHLREALDRFAAFFECPLLTEGATEREMRSVDSEHNKNLQEDRERMYQLQRSTATPGHPFNLFGTGCYKTLHDIPLANGVPVQQELLKFHAAYAPAISPCGRAGAEEP